MPRRKAKSNETAVVTTIEPEVVEAVVEVESKPRVHVTYIRKWQEIPGFSQKLEVPVGKISYFESTDSMTYEHEAGYEVFMGNLVGRDLRMKSGPMVQKIHLREWVQKFSDAVLDPGFFATKVDSFYDN